MYHFLSHLFNLLLISINFSQLLQFCPLYPFLYFQQCLWLVLHFLPLSSELCLLVTYMLCMSCCIFFLNICISFLRSWFTELIALWSLKNFMEFSLWLSSYESNWYPWSLASLSGLRIQHCHELQCRLQTWSGIPVTVAEASSCSSDLTPSLGTSICWSVTLKRQKIN